MASLARYSNQCSSGRMGALNFCRGAGIRSNFGKGNLAVRGFASQPSLDLEMPGMPVLSPVTPGRSTRRPEITTLPNGLRVISEDNHGSITAVGVFVDAGSRYETADNNGTSHLLEHMAFKSTTSRSSLRIVRDIENAGGQFSAASAREYALYNGECLRDNAEFAVELLGETLLHPRLAPWDIDEQRKVIGYDLEEMQTSAQALVTELLHAAAYTEQGALGMPLWCPSRNLEKLSEVDLKNFMQTHYTSDRMVLSACGIEHDALVSYANKYFGDLPSQPLNGIKPVKKPSVYVGSDRRVQADSPLTHVTLAFDAGDWNSPNILEICALHMLLGGGGSFSAGGPGKGMYSRLYTNVLNRNHWVDSCTAFNTMYMDGGLIGVYGTCEPKNAGRLVDVICAELENVASKPLSEEETNRAKNALKSSALMRLESRQATYEDLGRQLLCFGKYEPIEDICKRIDAITPASLQEAAKSALKSKLTMASFGDVSAIPYYEQVANRFA